jgi:hypothetical protein
MNPTRPTPLWARLITKSGYWCAIFTYSCYALDILGRVFSPMYYMRAFNGFIGAPTFVTCLTTLICGVALLKHRKAFGLSLLILGIVALFLWSLLIPEL